ncbi:MAG: ACT domain-containing protein [Arenicellales bacterium]
MTAAGRELVLHLVAGPLSIVRLPAGDPMPSWIEGASWFSVTRTQDELSVVCDSRLVPPGTRQNRPWQALRVEGPLDFELTGILCRIAGPLADAGISIFAVSTYDTDYVLVRQDDLREAVARLRKEGMIVNTAD